MLAVVFGNVRRVRLLKCSGLAGGEGMSPGRGRGAEGRRRAAEAGPAGYRGERSGFRLAAAAGFAGESVVVK